jgi:hypothetical protein
MTKSSKRASSVAARAIEAAELRGRVLLILATIEREEPGETWARFRLVVENAKRLTDLRTIHREIRGILAAMSPSAREQLERDLEQRFGSDSEQIRDQQVIAKVRSVGRIRSEREFRIVQAYLDSMPPNASEGRALGALLDEFMAAS